MASMQRRKVLNIVGILGLLQLLTNGFTKEPILPKSANIFIFLIAHVLKFTLALCPWVVISFNYGMIFSDLNIGILYIFVISTFGVYGILR
ncbi:hypothetical protein Mapa_009689 [Marchantia paleacea]|nr:hypothetical protein Mapa_009689 [Marchantia paleacea]